MKKVLIVLGVLVVIVVGALFYISLNVNKIIAHYKPDLEKVASETLGTKVSLGNLAVSVFPSTGVSIDSLKLSRGSSDGLVVKDVSVQLRLKPLLSERFEIADLTINSPKIVIVKDSSGVNIEGLPKNNNTQSEAVATKEVVPTAAAQAPAAPLAIALDKFTVKNGTIIFKDTVAGNETNVTLDGSLALEIVSNIAKTKIRDFAITINKEPLKLSLDTNFDLEKQNLTVNGLNLRGFSGEITDGLSLSLQGEKPFSTTLEILALDLTKVMNILPSPPPQRVVGNLARLAVKMKGELGGDLKNSLDGNVELSVKDGGIEGINVAGKVINALSAIPVLQGGLMGAIPEEAKASLASNNTAIKSMTGQIVVKSGAVQINSLNLISDLFMLEGQGTIASNNALDLKTTLYFDPQFSLAIAGKIKEASAVLDSQNRIAVPLAITGVPPSVVVTPNVDKLLELGARKAIEQGAAKLLEKGLNKKGLGKMFGF